jgi:hypothetical protein
MENKKRFAPETVQGIQAALDALPPCEATEMSKQQAVQALSPQIDEMRAKGYGWTAIAAMLSERGLPVSPAALRTYLRRGRTDAPVAKVRRPTKRSAYVSVSPSGAASGALSGATTIPPAAAATGAATSSASLRAGEVRARAPAERAAAAAKSLPGTPDTPLRPTPQEPEPRHAFRVRPDTDDI